MLRVQMRWNEREGALVPRVALVRANQVFDVLQYFQPDALPRLKMPALLCVASRPETLEEDRQAGISALKTRIAPMTVRGIPDAGHDVLLDNPTNVSDAVWDFLCRHTPS